MAKSATELLAAQTAFRKAVEKARENPVSVTDKQYTQQNQIKSVTDGGNDSGSSYNGRSSNSAATFYANKKKSSSQASFVGDEPKENETPEDSLGGRFKNAVVTRWGELSAPPETLQGRTKQAVSNWSSFGHGYQASEEEKQKLEEAKPDTSWVGNAFKNLHTVGTAIADAGKTAKEKREAEEKAAFVKTASDAVDAAQKRLSEYLASHPLQTMNTDGQSPVDVFMPDPQRDALQAEVASAEKELRSKEAEFDASKKAAASKKEPEKPAIPAPGSQYDDAIAEQEKKVASIRAELMSLSDSDDYSYEAEQEVQQRLSDAQNELNTLKQKQSAEVVAADRAEDAKTIQQNLFYISQLPEEVQDALQTMSKVRGNRQMANLPGAEIAAAEKVLKDSGLSEEKIWQCTESLRRVNNADISNTAITRTYNATQYNALAATGMNAAGVVMSPISGVAGTLEGINQTFQNWAHGGYFKTADANAIGFLPTRLESTIVGATSDQIVGDGNNPVREGLGYLYRGGVNGVKNLARSMVFSGGSSLMNSFLASTGAFASTFQEVTERGGNPLQAMSLAFTDAALEAITETQTFADVLKFKNADDGVSFFRKLATSMGHEITQEEASLLGNTFADAVVMQEKSKGNDFINEQIANGADYNKARFSYFKDVLHEVVDTAVETVISTGFMDGLAAAPGAIRKARTTLSDLNDNSTVFDNAGVVETEQAPARSPIGVIEDMLATGEKVTSNMLNAVLNDKASVQELREQGVPLDGTKSENRQAVLDALTQRAALAEQTEQAEQNAPEVQATPGVQAEEAPAEPEKSESEMVLEGLNSNLAQQVQEANGISPDERTKKFDIGRDFFYNLGKNGKELNPTMLGDYADVMDWETASESYNAGRKAAVENGAEQSGDIYLPDSEKWSDSTNSAGLFGRVEEVAGELDGDLGRAEGQPSAESPENAGGKVSAKDLNITGGSNDKTLTVQSKETYTEAQKKMDQEATESGMELTFVDGMIPFRDGSEADGICSFDPETGKARLFVTTRNGEVYSQRVFNHEQTHGKIATGAINLTDLIKKMQANYGTDGLMYYINLYADSLGGRLSDESIFEEMVCDAVGKMNNVVSEGTSEGEMGLFLTDLGNIANEFDSSRKNPSTQQSPGVNELTREQWDALYNRFSGKGGNQQNQNGNTPSTVGMQAAPSDDTNQSKTVTNSGLQSPDDAYRQAYEGTVERNPDIATYNVSHNAGQKATAEERTSSPEKRAAEADYLLKQDYWNATDVQTAKILTKDALQRGDIDLIDRLAQKRKEIGSRLGQAIQAFSEATESAGAAVDNAFQLLNSLNEKDVSSNTLGGKDFETWLDDTKKSVADIGAQIENVQDGDAATLRDIIREIAKSRRTTAWFGYSDKLTKRATNALNKADFATLKTIVQAQLAYMPNDFKKTSVTSGIHSFAINAMLFGGPTVNRNLEGNSAVAILDSLSASSFGQLIDKAVSKATGQREVGNDLRQTSEYWRGAKEATDFASLCVELNIPIEQDVGSGERVKYSSNTRTFKTNGNPVIRALSAWEKYMQYALGVSDSFFEGGAKAAVRASLQEINSGNADTLADIASKERTFKDDGKLAELTDSLRQFGNKLLKIGDIGLGDMVMPFAKVPANVAQVGADYTAGLVTGGIDIAKIISDARKGKQIEVGRQQRAVLRTSRGITGMALTGAFVAAAKAGILKVSAPPDKDEKYAVGAENLRGAQFNISAFLRALSGGSAEYQKGDVLRSEDSLEPFNTQMYLGYAIAKSMEDGFDIASLGKDWFSSYVNSFLDSPVVQGISDAMNIISDLQDVESDGVESAMEAAELYALRQGEKMIPQAWKNAVYALDNTERDTKGQTPLETELNRLKSMISTNLRQTLPAKYDISGEQTKMYDNQAFALLEKMLDPQTLKTYNPNDITNSLVDLNEQLEGKASKIFIDSSAPKSFKVNKEDVLLDTKEIREQYMETYTNAAKEIYSGILGDKDFQALSPEEQADVLATAKGYAKELAQESVSDYSRPDSTKDLNNKELAEYAINNKYVSKSGYSKEGYAKAKDAGFAVDEMPAMASASSALKKSFDAKNISDLNAAEVAYNALTKKQRDFIRENADGATRDWFVAKEAGVSNATFMQIYKERKDIDTDAKDADTQWGNILGNYVKSGKITKEQSNTLFREMGIYGAPNLKQATNYYKIDAFIDNPDTSAKFASNIQKTEKLEGEKELQDWQILDAIVKTEGVSDDDIRNAILGYGTSLTKEEGDEDSYVVRRYKLLEKRYGNSKDAAIYYVLATKAYAGKASTKHADIEAAFRKAGFPAGEANYLMQVFTGKIK